MGGRRADGAVAVAAVALYLAVAGAVLGHLSPADATRLPVCACGDQVQQVWWLALAHSDVVRGHWSFLTTAIDHPAGVNALDSASLPLLGVLASPITAVAGPVAAYAVLVRTAFVVSALACCLVLRRVGVGRVGAVAGGLVFGFSPYMTHQAARHVFLAFVPLVPVMALLVFGAVRSPGSPVRRGLLLGAVAVAQFFICSEVLVSAALVLGVTLAVLATAHLARRPGRGGSRVGRLHEVGRAGGRLVRLVGAAAVVAVPLLAYPAWFALAGPRHVVGATQPVTGPGIDLPGLLRATGRDLVAGRLWHHVEGLTAIQGDTAFVGPVLVVVALVVAWHRRRRPLVAAAAAGGAVAVVLACGPRLVWGSDTGIPLPFAVVAHLPVLQDVVPSRLTLWVDLAVAVLVAVALDDLVVAAAVAARRRSATVVTPVAGIAAVAVGVAAVLPAVAYPAQGVGAAALFASSVTSPPVPPGAVVLAWPYPEFPGEEAMLWQALAGMRFSLVGGYAERPGPAGAQTKSPQVLLPSAVTVALAGARSRSARAGTTGPGMRHAGLDLAAFVRTNGVTALVVDGHVGHPARALAFLARVLGRPAARGPFDVWTDLGRLRPVRVVSLAHPGRRRVA